MAANGTNGTTTAAELSDVEHAKIDGHNLRGTILETVKDGSADSFGDADKQLLKFHGVYQGFDRDNKMVVAEDGTKKKSWQFMIRVCAPGGRVTADQYLAIDALASSHANDTIKLTTRQAFQLHGIAKGDLWGTMHGITEALMTSLTACGDIPRNMMAPPAPYTGGVYPVVQQMAADLAEDLRPATGAYHEIWVDGEKVIKDGDFNSKEESFYTSQYLPRKFKIGVAIDFDNSIDLYAYDAGLVAVTEGAGPDNPADNTIVGYNILAGGGLGMTHNRPDTIARIASEIGFVAPEHGREAMRQLVAVYRDFGDRSDRKHARLKYLIEQWGVEKFRDALRERCDFEVAEPRKVRRPVQLDHVGRFDQGDGKQFVGVWVENGRVRQQDAKGARTREAFRKIATDIKPPIVLTPMQSIIFADLTPDQADRVEAILDEHDIARPETLSRLTRFSMACVAYPTCGLAIAEAERVSPDIFGKLDGLFAELGIDDTDVVVRMTGCPNGCARPYNADIGFVGKKKDAYHIYVGGGINGDRIADLFADTVPADKINDTLRPLLARYAAEREPGEGLSDYYRRAIAKDRPQRTLLTGKEEPTNALYSLEVLN